MANPLVAPGLADRLRKAMALRGQSFRVAATGIRRILGTKTTGASRGQLQNYARDQVHNPRIDVLQAWAETLTVRVDWLIKGAGPPTREEADASEAVERLLAGTEEGMEIPVELREAVELAGGTGIVSQSGPAGVQAYLETVRRLVRLHGSSPSISEGELATLIRTLNRHMSDLYSDFAMGVALLPPKRGFRAVKTRPGRRPSDKLTIFVVAFSAMIMAILPDPK